jgi:hypothetical protein
MAFPTKVNQLCTPSYVYFFLAIIALAISALQNIGNNKKYSLGSFSCNVPSCFAIFIAKIIYILFWTWILNLICKDGHKGIAWVLVLFPFILMFLIILSVMMYQRRQQSQQRKRNIKYDI